MLVFFVITYLFHLSCRVKQFYTCKRKKKMYLIVNFLYSVHKLSLLLSICI